MRGYPTTFMHPISLCANTMAAKKFFASFFLISGKLLDSLTQQVVVSLIFYAPVFDCWSSDHAKETYSFLFIKTRERYFFCCFKSFWLGLMAVILMDLLLFSPLHLQDLIDTF